LPVTEHTPAAESATQKLDKADSAEAWNALMVRLSSGESDG